MEFVREPIAGIGAEVWQTMLGLEARVGPELDWTESRGDFVCCVQITGDWNGAVTLRCPRELAVELASRMFGTEPAETGDSLLRDAVGELTNIVAGHVKCLSPDEENHVSMPAVAEGRPGILSIPGSRPVGDLWFSCSGAPMHLTVLERAPA